MWSRKELKEKGQKRFVQNYWKAVLAGLVLIIALGRTGNITEQFNSSDTNGISNVLDIDEGLIQSYNMGDDISDVVEEIVESNVYRVAPIAGLIAMIGIFAVSIGIVIKFFVLNPLEVGGRNFFIKNLDEEATVSLLGSGFNQQYIYTVKTMFLKDLFTFLWSLLFVVPGIIKAYEYRMIPYLIAENPELTTDEAFEMSKRMMTGNKWDAFVLDLSFIGWHILSGITLGAVGIFYVNPYQFSTNAVLYRTLLSSDYNRPDDVVEYANYEEVE